jgi:hypothetical protein
MRSMICSVVAVAAAFTLTGMTIASASAATRLAGTFADNSTALCHVTAIPGEGSAINTQSQGGSATFHFDGAGSLTVEFLNNSSNIPAGTRSTSVGACQGAYFVDADDFVTTDVNCSSETIDGVGTGNTNLVASIKTRFLKVGDTLLRMPAGPPAEEIVIIATPGGTLTQLFRKCSRVGTMHKSGR